MRKCSKPAPTCTTHILGIFWVDPSTTTLIFCANMEDLEPKEAEESELGHWLNAVNRCFGDKGDVEDITEGQ